MLAGNLMSIVSSCILDIDEITNSFCILDRFQELTDAIRSSNANLVEQKAKFQDIDGNTVKCFMHEILKFNSSIHFFC